MINACKKGKAGERELVNWFRALGFAARRTQQHCGYVEGDPDVIVEKFPGLHIECKRNEKLNIVDALAQAIRDASKKGRTPSVFHRKNRTDWMITLLASDFVHFFRVACELASKEPIGAAPPRSLLSAVDLAPLAESAQGEEEAPARPAGRSSH